MGTVTELVFPDVKAAGDLADAQERTRAPVPARIDAVPAAAAEPMSRTQDAACGTGTVPAASRLRDRVQLAALPKTAAGVFTGVALADKAPPTLRAEWALHKASASFYSSGLLRWPRYAFGVQDMATTALLYWLRWVKSSPPRLAGAVMVMVTMLLLAGWRP